MNQTVKYAKIRLDNHRAIKVYNYAINCKMKQSDGNKRVVTRRTGVVRVAKTD